MLGAEEASTRLASLRDPQWRDRASSRVRKLRRKLREPAQAFLAPPPAHHVPAAFRQYQERQVAAARQLDELSDGQRASIMDVLHPGLGPALARWWADAQSRPYQRRWDRKAFRAAHSPGLTVEGRGSDLAALINLVGPLNADPVWLAGWAGHLATADTPVAPVPRTIGGLLASAIDLGGRCGEETLAALIAVGNGEHPTGIMGGHVIVALLGSSRPEGWAFIERLLLAAQRQEGLRQTILEAADEGHPEAFDRILATVLDNKLLRFAAAVRAAGVWLGFGAQVADIPHVEARVRKLAVFRANPVERSRGLASGDPWDVYVALCAQGMRDVLATIPEAQTLARDPSPGIRAAALRYAAATTLMSGQRVLAAAVYDLDVRVASLAVALLTRDGWRLPGTFDALTRLVPRLPAKAGATEALGVESAPVTLSQAGAAGWLVSARVQQPVSALLPWLPSMDVNGRLSVAAQITKEPVLTAELRKALFDLLGDRSSYVRGHVIKTLGKTRLAPSEAPAVEALLTRGAADVRRGALTLLASLPPDAARASADRLAASADKGQREAATELLRALGASGGSAVPPITDRLQARGARTSRSGGVPSSAAAGRAPIEDLRSTLVDAQARTPPRTPLPPNRRRSFGGDSARRTIEALDEIAEEHRNTPVLLSSWQGSREMLFGDIRWFPSPFADARPVPADEDDGRGMLLGEVFRGWWAARPAALHGEEGLDALHAHVTAQLTGPASPFATFVRGGDDWWHANMQKLVGSRSQKLRQPAAVRHIANWLVAEHASGKVIDECLDALEASLAMVPGSVLTAAPASDKVGLGGLAGFAYPGRYSIPHHDWRHRLRSHPWHALLDGLLRTQPGLFAPEQITRWYQLMRWVEQPHSGAAPLPVEARLLVAAHDIGAASEDDVIASFLHPRSALFRDLTRRWRGQLESRHPALIVIADKVRDRLVAVELQREDLPTPTSPAALNVCSVSGVTLVIECLQLLGKTSLVRGGTGGSDSRDAMFSHLIRVCFPAPADTAEQLRAAADEAGVPAARLVDLAVYAPQWAPLVEEALSWPGLADGVLWLHAHTKDQQWSVDRELRESWAAMAAERTPLTGEDLMAGAVDVTWFRASHTALGSERWAVLHRAAKHASGGNGHRRAQLFAEAMLGQLDEGALTDRITTNRNQDAVRALGLLPLPDPKGDRQEATQRRYAVLREFERGSQKFGSQRQASERTAVRIGIENLARTAGYTDPGRFVWMVEAREAGDLADGPVTITQGDVTFTLSVTADGTPNFAIRRGGRMMRSIPASLRKAQDVVELYTRKTTLTRQAARVRMALESAMIAQDTFSADDFAELSRHPVVAPMLDQFVWVDDQGRTLWRTDGHVTTADAKTVTARGPLRLAHPGDLATGGTWVTWQERLFTEERRQPFKQVFRELYVLTAAERQGGPASHRYDGHQLQPRQALALLGPPRMARITRERRRVPRLP